MMPAWLLALPLNLITSTANLKRVEPELIAAIVSVESSGKTCATRYEPHFKWLVSPEVYAKRNEITEITEVVLQKTSFGLMQVMGAVARELGYSGPLVDLCKPEVGLFYGIDKITSLIDKYENLEDAVSAYNQGSPRKTSEGLYHNQHYVDKVMSRYEYLISKGDT